MAGLFILAIGAVEIDLDMGFEGHLSFELRLWTIAHLIALIVAIRFGSVRYLVATWALYVGMNYKLWSYLSADTNGQFATLPTFWYVLGAWSVLGLIAALAADKATTSFGSK